MESKILYGLDKGGKYKVWNIWTEESELYIMHGQENGKMQAKCEVVQGKNIGRSNETSPAEQAELEAMSRWKKQIDKGYREHKGELTELPLLPMLAHDYLKQGHRIKYPCWTSPKLDGVRCLAICTLEGVTLKSRGGKEYDVDHIQDQLSSVMIPGEVWDGELYIHGKYLEEIVSAVKKPNANSRGLKFVVFDIVNDAVFDDRINGVLLCSVGTDIPDIESIEYTEVANEQEMKAEHKRYVAEGYEGVMLRNHSGKYESGKRSADLQKYKEFFDEEFEVVDVIPDKDGGAIFVVKNTFANNQFNVVGGSHEQRKQWLSDKTSMVGKHITVKYQSLYKDTNIPQFPTFVSFREGVFNGKEFQPDE